jgi:hypothetical protein
MAYQQSSSSQDHSRVETVRASSHDEGSNHSREESTDESSPFEDDPDEHPDPLQPLNILCSPDRHKYGNQTDWQSVYHPISCTRLVRFPCPDNAFLPCHVRGMIAQDISQEVLHSAKLIYLCFRCSTFTVGKICYAHHIKECLYHDLFKRLPHAHSAPDFWKWANCGHCFRQEVLAERFHYIPSVCAPLHWARLLRSLAIRRHRLAPLLNSKKRSVDAFPLAYEISLFLA